MRKTSFFRLAPIRYRNILMMILTLFLGVGNLFMTDIQSKTK